MSPDIVGFADGPYAPILAAPVHIEGSDPSLATEVLPAPPPLAFIKLPMNKRPGDLSKRPLPSFIPSSDPGSTYATHGIATPMVVSASSISAEEQGRRKRARLDKTALNRAPRPSTRLSTNHAASSPLPESTQPSSSVPTHTSTPVSASNPSPLEPQPPDPNMPNDTSASSKKQRGRPKKLKADGKPEEVEIDPEVEPEPVREPAPVPFRNDDICACCSVSHGNSNASPLSHFLYCDGCTRSFHLGCLDPPIIDIEDHPPPDKEWFCPACTADKSPPRLPRNPGPFDLLIHYQQQNIPTVYQLPEEVRGYFKDVMTGFQGAYQDSSEVKPGKADRRGFLEDRDPYRLKDRNSNYITCYRCNRSAAPHYSLEGGETAESSKSAIRRPSERKAKAAADAAIQKNQRMISCDYCHLHWHLDCLDPPLTVMPPPLKKWMCPNHADNVMPHRRSLKTPKVVEVKARGVWNNGNIEIIPSAEDMAADKDSRYEEIWINSKKYMIPERTIRLDFLEKAAHLRNPVPRPQPPPAVHSSPTLNLSSSPLTSLSSLTSLSDDEDREREMSDMDISDSASASDAAKSLLLVSQNPSSSQNLDRTRIALSIPSNSKSTPETSSLGKPIPTLVKSIFGEAKPLASSQLHNSLTASADAPVFPSSNSFSNGRRTPSPTAHPSTESHVKAGSTATSFRIRLTRPGGTRRASIVPPKDIPVPSPEDPKQKLSVSRGTSSTSSAASAGPAPMMNGSSTPSLAPQEIEQLLNVRALMLAKGEHKMLAFLNSD